MSSFALAGARIFDGETWFDDHALIVDNGRVSAVEARENVLRELPVREAGGAMIVPGFIDLQVNGGGGVMFDGDCGVEGLSTICRAHARFGTTGLLPTLITDTRDSTTVSIAAGLEAARTGMPGFLGLHLEGPHLSIERKGAHDPALIRPMEERDLAALIEARKGLPSLIVTLAPENVTVDQVRTLVDGGVKVSLGHTNTTCKTALAYAEAGASLVTHLFNAMSPLAHREPGVVGAALQSGQLWVGIIADGIHVDPVAIGVALRAKNGPARLFAVTDAMSTIGTDMTSFTLNGRTIMRENGRLTLADGTLAGADIDMISTVVYLHRTVGLSLEEALRMVSVYPAQAIGLDHSKGRLAVGKDADFVILDDDLGVVSTWIGGEAVYSLL
ncbi:N-acetylglucosamine-6-phosphate deacetylase [Nitratireductor kimnyeongensis]|uniref:N-acetylglucosamine-6-phosphate deacetylase n=1 Tax=Nitratireductor kimnyeongensis TaxID=430679 RepID=A0ABW0T752_9HYPH|nr:N-acetylglucosamine-6-phosphate deacetylase [Nitratireductor kimnyeongensis]QZZ36373.1 N-acetylglucosamine-6-phosphate deacetylase [Nitratireductor kimnyeongensis]